MSPSVPCALFGPTCDGAETECFILFGVRNGSPNIHVFFLEVFEGFFFFKEYMQTVMFFWEEQWVEQLFFEVNPRNFVK